MGRAKLTIEEMQALAKNRGGKCLSKKYVNQDTHLEWECAEGHRWKAKSAHVKNAGSWCPECAGIKKLTIEEMRKMAKSRGGKCLSKKYINHTTKLDWKCAKGHKWKTSPCNVTAGKWCPKCSGSQKLTIEEMQKIAKSRGGKCLSKKYVNQKIKLEWECSEGHRWLAGSSRVKSGRWCHECGRKKPGLKKRLGIEAMKELARTRGGKCLSSEYTNSGYKLKWECSEGHQWMATPLNIKNNNRWCPHCANLNQKLTIQEMHAIAKSRGGKCLSKKYVDSSTELKWECAKGHRWLATPGTVKHHLRWCNECKKNAHKNLIFEELRAIAKSRGGKCLSKKYDWRAKLKWECSEGHQWFAFPGGIKGKKQQWCPKCSGLERRLTIEDMHKIAKSRGGKCLSKKYLYAISKLKWECSEGHQWMASPNQIQNNKRWCPICSTGISERICKAYFQQIFGEKFPKRYPRWLKNSRGNQMELDGYCKKLKIAFEHQGEQHYSTKSRYLNTKGELAQRKKDDKEKVKLCEKHGIRLFLIPQLFSKTKLEDLSNFLFEECKRLKVRRPAGMLDKKINLKNAWSNNLTRTMYEELSLIAKSRGGKCVSGHYITAKTKLKFQCGNGHQWMSDPDRIKSGAWCPKCAGNKKLTIEQMQAIAKELGGQCVSKKYINNTTKLEWKCAKGHRWKMSPSKVKHREHWCKICQAEERKKRALEEMQEIAKSRSGKCLSKTYVNSNAKLKWKCVKGRRWEAKPRNVKSGNWCSVCSHASRRKTSYST